jgi:hypothetical protein
VVPGSPGSCAPQPGHSWPGGEAPRQGRYGSRRPQCGWRRGRRVHIDLDVKHIYLDMVRVDLHANHVDPDMDPVNLDASRVDLDMSHVDPTCAAPAPT